MKRVAIKRKKRKPRHDHAMVDEWYRGALTDNRERHKGRLTCDVTGTSLIGRPDFQVHHVIPKGWLWSRRWDFDDVQKVIWDRRNAMVILTVRHDTHTSAYDRIPRYHLPPAAFDFAEENGLLAKLEDEYPK